MGPMDDNSKPIFYTTDGETWKPVGEFDGEIYFTFSIYIPEDEDLTEY